MSEMAIGVAVFKSVCPGTARTMRAVSAKVTVCSAPLSVVSTTDVALTALTVPTALATGAWADAAETTSNIPAIARLTALRGLGLLAKRFMYEFYYQLNHAVGGAGGKELSNGDKETCRDRMR